MARDIYTAGITGTINNGNIIVGQAGDPWFQKVDDPERAVNVPTSGDIAEKYDGRWAYPTYY